MCGITFIELLVVMAIAGILAVLGNSIYSSYVESARFKVMVGDIRRIEVLIERFRTDNGRLPDSLGDIGGSIPRDPFGSPYEYFNIEDAPPSARGRVRKDRNLVPINSDYDLYSRGPDGDTRPPLTARPSRDDIVRAANGGFVGPASEY